MEDPIQAGLRLAISGKTEEALSYFLDILSSHSDNAEILNLIGALYGEKKEWRLAESYITRALSIRPGTASFLENLGLALAGQQKLVEAVDCYESALQIHPRNATIYLNLAVALLELNRLDDCLSAVSSAISLGLQTERIFNIRGVALSKIGNTAAAIDSFKLSLRVNPHFTEALINYAKLLTTEGNIHEALRALDQAVSAEPSNPIARNNRASARFRVGDDTAALYDVEIALKVSPNYLDARLTRASILAELARFDEALEEVEAVLKVDPSRSEAKWNKGLLLLLRGDFKEGWQLYESGLECGQRKPRTFPQSRWTGQPLRGKTIFLYHEQGYGDTIQFCRFTAVLAQEGARVILEVPPKLFSLLRSLEGVNSLLTTGAKLPDFDFHSPLLSIPSALSNRGVDAPPVRKYLSINCEKVRAWESRLGVCDKPRLGVAWSGSAKNPRNDRRNIPLASLLGRLPQGYEYVSLQTNINESDAEALAGSGIRHFGDELTDFSDTAALCELCDRVITIDTSVAHLNAALGRPTEVLLGEVPDWRWMLDRTDTPWYPTMTLNRTLRPFSVTRTSGT